MPCDPARSGKAVIDFAGQGTIRLPLYELRIVGWIARGPIFTGITLDHSLIKVERNELSVSIGRD